MRYYELSFQGSPYKLNESNPWGLDINFQIQATSNAAHLIPTTIEIINGPLDLFTKSSEAIKGAFMTFKAGIKNAPYMKHQNIPVNAFDMPLAVGRVGSNFSQWELTDTRLSLQLNSVPLKSVNMSFQLEKGAPVAAMTAAFLNQIFATDASGVIFTIDASALAVTNQNQSTTAYQYKGTFPDMHSMITDVCHWLRAFRLCIAYSGNEMKIYHIDEPSVTPYSMVNLHPSMLITQPTYADVKTTQLELFLNPNITLGSLINISAGMNLFSGTLLGDVAGVILRDAFDSKLLQQGLYRCVEVVHRGESRNPDPRAWSTTVKAVKV